MLRTAGVLAGAPFLAGEVDRSPSRVLALGDSYTFGTAVSPDDRWVDELPARLRDEGFVVAAPRVVAATGWATAQLDRALERRSLGDDHDLVTLLVGANNAFRGWEPAAFRAGFVDLLERSVALAGGEASRVVALTIPDYTVTPVGRRYSPAEHADRLTAYNRAVREEATRAGARVVDLVPVSRLAADRPELVATDGFHPSPRQYDLWLERILPAAVAALTG